MPVKVFNLFKSMILCQFYPQISIIQVNSIDIRKQSSSGKEEGKINFKLLSHTQWNRHCYMWDQTEKKYKIKDVLLHIIN